LTLTEHGGKDAGENCNKSDELHIW
jgi:hypothetical protein